MNQQTKVQVVKKRLTRSTTSSAEISLQPEVQLDPRHILKVRTASFEGPIKAKSSDENLIIISNGWRNRWLNLICPRAASSTRFDLQWVGRKN